MPRAKSFEDEVEYYRQRSAARVAEARAAFEASAAVHAQWRGKHPRSEMWILSEDTHPVPPGQPRPWRISRFDRSGPFGHDVANTREEAFALAGGYGADEVTPMTDAEVIAWTSTPQYQEGVKHVAFMQAINAVSWNISKHGHNEPQLREAYDEGWRLAHAGKLEEATELLERALRGRQNPPPDFVPNPAWVARAVANNWQTIVDNHSPLPKFGAVRASRNRITATMRELGCGAYGCVLPTEDPSVVLKITTDATEMEFVTDLLKLLPVPITTRYDAATWVRGTHNGRRIGMLLRESADYVGKIEEAIGGERGMDVVDLIKDQHEAAGKVLVAASREQYGALPGLIAVWATRVERMANEPELAYVARGMLAAWHQRGIFFADVHEGNLGRVMRDGRYTWVITDPGNVIVVE